VLFDAQRWSQRKKRARDAVTGQPPPLALVAPLSALGARALPVHPEPVYEIVGSQ
jgi:hypothetical protein